ncbi:putative toxin-antitoxin system toxin component, PIN family [Olivibacter sp. XZL3]|uniref:putative toxin-antitoxin system toxin component, PIN family n=1 Tax=Olivibacter sp. XZL3 TaxID=1735116 RepID=UPI001064F009|nr:putative toxin-antitoxin system toxin component, PIN family [Olivibacter sp. XZL3]
MAGLKPKLVIDTNVLITTINRSNPEFAIYEAFEKKAFEWIVSTEILTEYAEQLTNFYSEATANFVLDILCTATNVIFTEAYYRWKIIKEDPDDNKFADLALSASADALLTFDKHFNVFNDLSFPVLNILHPKEFSAFMKK